MGSECAEQGAVLRLCALVVRSAAGLEDDAEPVLTAGSEAARVLALSAKAEHDAARAEVGGITTALRHACDRRDEARAEVERLRAELAHAYRWVRQHADPYRIGDHACARCMHGYAEQALVIDGFVCVRHRAFDAGEDGCGDDE